MSHVICPTAILEQETDSTMVVLRGVHQCTKLAGLTLTAQFSLGAGNQGEGDACGCRFVVPPNLWQQVTAPYRLAQRLEGD